MRLVLNLPSVILEKKIPSESCFLSRISVISFEYTVTYIVYHIPNLFSSPFFIISHPFHRIKSRLAKISKAIPDMVHKFISKYIKKHLQI